MRRFLGGLGAGGVGAHDGTESWTPPQVLGRGAPGLDGIGARVPLERRVMRFGAHERRACSSEFPGHKRRWRRGSPRRSLLTEPPAHRPFLTLS